MPAIREIDHIHQYKRIGKRVSVNKDRYMCDHPSCYSIMHARLLEGKYSLCNECGVQFQLSKADLKLARPKCMNCSNTKEAVTLRKGREIAQRALLGKKIDGDGNEVPNG